MDQRRRLNNPSHFQLINVIDGTITITARIDNKRRESEGEDFHRYPCFRSDNNKMRSIEETGQWVSSMLTLTRRNIKTGMC